MRSEERERRLALEKMIEQLCAVRLDHLRSQQGSSFEPEFPHPSAQQLGKIDHSFPDRTSQLVMFIDFTLCPQFKCSVLVAFAEYEC